MLPVSAVCAAAREPCAQIAAASTAVTNVELMIRGTAFALSFSRSLSTARALLWDDDGIARLQHDVLLCVLLAHYILVVELEIPFLSVLFANDYDVLDIGVLR